VHQVHRFALCTLRIEIVQHDLGGETAQKQRVCGGGADMSRADDRDSMWMASSQGRVVAFRRTQRSG
jgi:hypothetical protein